MVTIRNSFTHKAAILAVLTLLALGTVSAQATWENPSSSGESFSTTTIDLLMTTSDVNTVDFWYKESSSSNYTFLESVDNSTGTLFNSSSFSQVSGSYDLLVNYSDNGEVNATVNNIVLDGVKPSVSNQEPQGYVQGSPTVSVDPSDEHSGVDYTYLNVTEMSSDEKIANTTGTSLDLSDLSEGDYQVNVKVVDNAGNVRNDNWVFTVDTSYDGDTSPSVSPGPQVFRSEGEPVRVYVNVSEQSEDSDIRVSCLNDDAEIYQTDFSDVNGYELFHCDIDPANYMDISVALDVMLEDRAGNSWTSDVGEYTFDFSPPEFGNLSTPVEIFSQDFQVDYDSDDKASSVEKIHYQIDDDAYGGDKGDNLSAGSSFLVNVSGISSGEHTVYAWAIDEAGWVSDRSSLDFEYMPSATPKVQIDSPERVEVEAGSFTTVEVNVTDTGQLLVKDLEVSADAEFWNDSQTIDRLTPEEISTLSYTINTDSEDMGSHRLLFSSQEPPATSRTELVVRANDDQKQDIESSYSEFSQRFEGLEANVSELLSKVGDERAERLESNFSDLNETMKKIEEAEEDGEYYKVSSLLEDAEEQFSVASTSYDTVQKEHQVSVRNRNILILFFLFVTGGVGAYAYVEYGENDLELDLDSIPQQLGQIDFDLSGVELEIDAVKEKINDVVQKLKEEEQEVEEYAFEGFN